MKHLIITGKNGSGKTTLLEGMRKYLQVIPDGDYNVGILMKKYNSHMEVYLHSNNIIKAQYNSGQFILAYFGAMRNIRIEKPKNVSKVELKDKYGLEEDIGKVFLNYLVYLKTQQSFARNEGDNAEVEKITKWFNKFETALQQLFEDNSIHLKFDYKNLDFSILQNNREPYGFDVLSDGYSAVLEIVVNIILRMEKNHGLAYDLEGIVLVDEIENHLHVSLQKKILPFLTGFFPNVQFIVTTHSPFVISSIDNAVIYDLENRVRVEDLSSMAYEGIVEGYFNVNRYSDEVCKKLKRYSILVEKMDKTESEEEEEFNLRSYLKGMSKELAPEAVLSFNKIELERKAKQKGVQK